MEETSSSSGSNDISRILIFLDVDGVLLPFSSKEIPAHTLSHFASILTAVPNSVVVLSSTWRCSPEAVLNLKEVFTAYGSPLSQCKFNETTDLKMHTVRCEEIAEYLRLYGESCENYVVLDDDAPPSHGIKGSRIVAPESHVGITSKDARRAISILTGGL